MIQQQTSITYILHTERMVFVSSDVMPALKRQGNASYDFFSGQHYTSL